MMRKTMKSGFAAIIIALFTVSAATMGNAVAAEGWKLDVAHSGLSFASIKSDNAGEVHHFTKMTGSIDGKGHLAVTINLASVETWIDIRNERMREYLFQTDKFPKASITTSLDLASYQDMPIGGIEETDVDVTLNLHGVAQKIEATVQVIRLAADRVLVIPGQIIMVDASAYKLVNGINKLKELAGLPSISTAVPVSFYFAFTRDQ